MKFCFFDIPGMFLVVQNGGGGGSPLARGRGDPPPFPPLTNKKGTGTENGFGLDSGRSADLPIG